MRELIESTVVGLGYEVVDVEFASSGLLRVYIDHPFAENAAAADPATDSAADGIGTVDGIDPVIQVTDCEKVSHQLGHVLLVEDFDYERLEVSSPGMDRPLKVAAHFRRFAGELVMLKLREPFEGRRNFQGVLTVEGEGRFGLELVDIEPVQSRGGKGKKVKRVNPADSPGETKSLVGQKLVFEVNEVDRARLVPQYEFRRH
ncbi:MAG: ribosome maturation factor RimP [Burkholderiaceae bacterium]